MTSNKKAALLGTTLVLALGAIAVAVVAIWHPRMPHARLAAQTAALDLGRPDALVASARLSALPRDLLRVPLLHEVLSEDVVDYYEHGEGRLSLAGTLRRIAFEHHLDLDEDLARRALDAPAMLALWRDGTGALRHWALLSQRNGWARLLQGAANVALGDSQLKRAGDLKAGGDTVPLYALAYGYQRNLLFAVHGDRLLVLSDPGMLLDDQGAVIGARGDEAGRLLDTGKDARPWGGSPLLAGQAIGLEAIAGHHVAVSASLLSFGYQAFFPAIEALGFDFAEAGQAPGWQTRALIDPAQLQARWDNAALWQVLPTGPAACASLPVDWDGAAQTLAALAPKGVAEQLAGTLAGPAAVCWYSKSSLAAPLFVARVRDASRLLAMKAQLQDLFAAAIGACEPVLGKPGRFPVDAREADGGLRWQRPVSAHYGTADAAGAPFEKQLASTHYFPVTLGVAHDVVAFSPDGRLVDDALAVLAKRYPAVADGMGADERATTVAQLTPASLARLIEQETFASLPADQEPIFRDAAQQYLIPKLHALANYPALSLRLPAAWPDKRGWVPVNWQAAGPAR